MPPSYFATELPVVIVDLWDALIFRFGASGVRAAQTIRTRLLIPGALASAAYESLQGGRAKTGAHANKTNDNSGRLFTVKSKKARTEKHWAGAGRLHCAVVCPGELQKLLYHGWVAARLDSHHASLAKIRSVVDYICRNKE